MQFKHPELLYALFLLLIPIIVHLFQLRKFQKVSFTNVEFLKNVVIQTRKSSIIKKWLTLITRLLLLAAIIIAFAQPYLSNNTDFNTKKETVIYLDNSFSMQAKGSNGSLLQKAIQDLITNIDSKETFTLITNNNTYKNANIATLKNELLQLPYSTNQMDYKAAVLQAKRSFSKDQSSLKNVILISDFQQKESAINIEKDSTVNLNLVQLKPLNTGNISIDSLYVSNTTPTNIELTVSLKNQGSEITNLPVSLYNSDVLLAKTSVNITDKVKTIFTIPLNEVINGKIQINDTQLQFDNTLFFNLNKQKKTNVLSVNNANDNFLKRVFTTDEFNFKSVAFNQLNYNDLEAQNLIILNELNSIPLSLITALNALENDAINIIIIPSSKSELTSYNQLLTNFNLEKYSSLKPQEKKITNINFSHPLFKDVFNNKVTNFQYPKVNNYYPLTTNNSSIILSFEDGKPFLIKSNNAYVFTSALNTLNSNYINSPLIVPTFYNIGKQSLKLSKPYYAIGVENKIDITTTLHQDDILSLQKDDLNIIPQQQTFSTKVSLTTNETPSVSGTYSINNKTESLENISYNYNRKESDLVYLNLNNLDNVTVSNSVTELINTIKSSTKINELWKWFVIFALIFLVFEMLILKYFK